MKLSTSKTQSVLYKNLILIALGLVLNTHLIAQTCSPAVAAPTLSATTQPLLCPALTADLSNLVTSTAPAGMVLEWHSVATNPSPANLVAMPASATGTFYAYYYDSGNNCYSAATAAVTVTNTAVAAPVATVTNNSLCVGGNGVITFTGPTPLSNYEFAIDGGFIYQSSPTFSGLEAGTYSTVVRLISTGCASAIVTKTIVAAPVAVTAPTVTVVNVTNCTTPNGSITVTAPTPLSNYEFSIDGVNFQADPVFDGLAGGTYNVVAKSLATGCVSAATVRTLTTPAITAQTTTVVNPTSCITGNGTITFTAPTPLTNYQFSIDGGSTYQTSASFTGLAAGAYDTRVKLISSGCESAIVVKTLTNPIVTAPTATVVNNTSCLTNNGTITVTAPTPLTNYQFSIDGGDTYQASASFTGLAVGSYNVVAKLISSGCESAAVAKAVADAPVAVTAPTATVGNPTSCITPNGTITITAPTPLSNYQFSIDGGTTYQATTNYTGLAAGTYNVTAKLLSTGCESAIVAKTLTNPVVTATTATVVNNTSCITPNGSITITAPTPTANYQFSIDGGNTYQSGTSFTGLRADAYPVVAKLISSGCQSVATVSTVTDAPVAVAAPTVTIGTVTNCITSNGSLTITAPTPLTNYQFSIDGGTTFSATTTYSGLTVGSYDVVAKLISTGCESPIASKVITSTAVTAPTATTVNNTNCATPNGSITVTAPTPTASYEFSIDGGDSFQAGTSFTGLTGGSYNVVAKLISTGCTSAATVKAITDAPVAVTSPITTLVQPTTCLTGNGSITFTAPTPLSSYEFSNDGGLTYQTSASFTALAAGTYNTRVRALASGCESAIVVATLAAPTVTVATTTLVNNTHCGTSPNGSITVTAPTPTANYTFSIDNGLSFQASPIFSNLTGGSYSVITKLTSTGCQSAVSVKTLTNAPAAIAAPAATTTNITNCNTPDGSIVFTTPTPLASYEFSIDGGATYQTSATFTGLPAGTYSLKARSIALACVSAATAKTLTAPTVTAITATTANPTSCTTPNGTITVTAPTPLSNYQFSIDGGTTFQAGAIFSNLAGGTYNVVAKLTISSCKSTAVAKTLTNPTVTAPTATVVNNTTCLTPNGSINVTAPTPLSSYSFSIDGGVNFQTNAYFPALGAATYNVVIQSVATGCKSAAVAKILTNAPAVVTAPTATQVNNTSCITPNGTITFTAPTPLSSYQFSIDGGTTFQASSSFTGLNGGVYNTVVKSIATGCKSAAVAKTLTNPTVTIPTATVVNNTSCLSPNGSITVTAPLPLASYEFSKDNGVTFQTSNVFSGLNVGTYNVVGRLIASGCKSTAVAKAVTNPTVTAPVTVVTNNTDCNSPNGKISFSSPTPLTNYSFSIDSGVTYQSSINFIGLTGKTYQTRVKLNASGCESAAVAKALTNPTVTVPTVTITNNSNCASPNGKLTMTAPLPLANYEFSIDGGTTFSTDIVYPNLTEGTYNVVAKLISTGCKSASTAQVITKPVIAAPVPTTFALGNTCPSTTVNLMVAQPVEAANTNLEWHTVGANPTAGTKVTTGTATQNYFLYSKSTINSCYSAASTAVAVTINSCLDTDGDGVPDYLDIDDDNDGVTDVTECPYLAAYTTNCAPVGAVNLVQNGDFEQGNVGFTSTYTFVTSSVGCADYSIQAGGWVSSVGSCSGGKHMDINADCSAPYTPFWCQTINVTPNTNYEFSFMGKVGNPPTQINVVVNGAVVINQVLTTTWARYRNIVNSGSSTTLTICLNDVIGVYNGDDFGIDDIQLIQYNPTNPAALCDTDGDGTPNHLDLDSDNDGCSDAFESGVTTSQTANYTFSGTVGTNGYMNNLETSFDNGVSNITPTYSKALDDNIHSCTLPCNAGTVSPLVPTTKQISCPSTTIDLGTITASNMPQTSGNVILTWHTGTPATDANKLTPAQTAVAPAGIYYVSFYDVDNMCYSGATWTGTSTTKVTITPCPICPTIAGIPNDTAICSNTLPLSVNGLANITTEDIKFVYFTTNQTDPSVIYGGTATLLDAVANANLTNSKTTATINATLPVNNLSSPIVYHVYAILSPTPIDPLCRPFGHVQVTVQPKVGPPSTTVTQPTCSVATGTITVTAPSSGVTYSFDNGTNYQASATSSALASGTYQVIVKDNTSACVSASTATVINAQPATATISNVSKTDPSLSSCPALNDGTLTVTATGSNLQYSNDNGTTWQASNSFTGLSAGSYILKVKDDVSACEAVYASNPVVLTAPTCPTCTTPSVGGTTAISVTLPLCSTSNNGVITLSGHTGTVVKWQTSTNGGTSWTDIASTSTTYAFTNAANNQQYRAVVNSGGMCVDATSSATTITTSAGACSVSCDVPKPSIISH